jgi:hypothetical protein
MDEKRFKAARGEVLLIKVREWEQDKNLSRQQQANVKIVGKKKAGASKNLEDLKEHAGFRSR